MTITTEHNRVADKDKNVNNSRSITYVEFSGHTVIALIHYSRRSIAPKPIVFEHVLGKFYIVLTTSCFTAKSARSGLLSMPCWKPKDIIKKTKILTRGRANKRRDCFSVWRQSNLIIRSKEICVMKSNTVKQFQLTLILRHDFSRKSSFLDKIVRRICVNSCVANVCPNQHASRRRK